MPGCAHVDGTLGQTGTGNAEHSVHALAGAGDELPGGRTGDAVDEKAASFTLNFGELGAL